MLRNTCLLFLLIAAYPLRLANACGPQDVGFEGYSFINAHIIEKEDPFAPFFLSWEDLYAHFEDLKKERYKSNVEEWQERICTAATLKDIGQVIYGATLNDLELMSTAARSKNLPIEPKWRSNSFAQYLDKLECYEAVDYLVFAKKCEPHVVERDRWSDNAKDYPAMEALIKEGRKAFRRTESEYIKQRYAYQIIRLAHYRGEYERTLKLYDDLVPKIDPVKFDGHPSIIYWWTLGHKAGALKSLGNVVEADYLFSLIFDKCPGKRDSAFQSFSIKNEDQWEQVMLLCQSDHERSMLYALRGHPEDVHAVEEMYEIYKLDPENPHLERLLVREIQKIERDLLGLGFNSNRRKNSRSHGIPRKLAGDYVIELQEFARKMRIEQQVLKPELWYLAEGYLELLAGDNYAAAQTFLKVKEELDEPVLIEQLEVFETALAINSFEKPTEAVEKEAYTILTDNEWYQKYKDFPDFLRDKMTMLYKKYKRPGKAFRCQHNLGELRANPQTEVIDDLMTICEDDDATSFARLLAQNEAGDLMTNDLWDMRGTLLFQEFQLEAALRAFKEIPYSEWDSYGVFDPFRSTIRDCIECPHSKDTLDLFNKGELLQELLELEFQAKAEPENAPKYYYQIGVALYNTSYFGHSWDARDYFRTGSIRFGRGLENNKFPVYGVPADKFPFGNKENLDVERALYFFKRAIVLSFDKELTAKAAFMASKCELAQYYVSKDYKRPCRNCIPNVPESYRTHFKLLKEELNETQFYELLIEECKYFKAYVK